MGMGIGGENLMKKKMLKISKIHKLKTIIFDKIFLLFLWF